MYLTSLPAEWTPSQQQPGIGCGSFHLALTAETPLSKRCFLGLQAEYLDIRTWGSHHWVETGTKNVDETWSNGVSATSSQNSLTAYLRARF